MKKGELKNRIGEKFITNKGEEIEIVEYFGTNNCTVRFSCGKIRKNIAYSSIKRGYVATTKNRVGEKYTTNEGYEVEIIEWFGCKNCTLLFKDGNKLYNRSYSDVKRGEIKNPNHKIGEKYKTKEGYIVEIIETKGWKNCTIKFNTGVILYGKNYGSVKKGEVKNPFHKSVCNIGYLGEYYIKSSSLLKNNINYIIWKHMIERCYDPKERVKYTSYNDVKVCDEWHCFSNFNTWCEINKEFYNRGWHLDKDILVKGNKIYSPKTCAFVPAEINTLFVKSDATRGNFPIGVTPNRINRFVSKIVKNNINIHLGTFDTPEEAFQAYKVEKEEYIKEVADKWKGQITDQVYQAMYNYQVEITD